VTPRTACAIPLSFFWLVTTASADPVALAASLIGRPYAWGAEGPGEFDCSGLTLYVYREFGVDLPRRAISQSRAGDPAGRRLQRGDLVFFSTDPRGSLVTHVGIYEGEGMMIDASKRYGKVRRDSLDDDYWVERFLFARRVADAEDVVEVSGPRPQSPPPSPSARGDRRKAAVRVLEQVADIFLRRPRR
jgi:NlpC/P60 family